jgi:hypothetical protein
MNDLLWEDGLDAWHAPGNCGCRGPLRVVLKEWHDEAALCIVGVPVNPNAGWMKGSWLLQVWRLPRGIDRKEIRRLKQVYLDLANIRFTEELLERKRG